MKINKYNKPKEVSGNRLGGNTIISNVVTTTESSDTAKKLAETHNIWGLPFNGTLDISGDISNALNISTLGGNITVKADGSSGGSITADGNITAGNNVIGQKFIGDVEADTVDTDKLNASTGAVDVILGTSLTYDEAEIQLAIIDALQSTNITTEFLTVTKQAHFFELIIDKIKAAGGAVILSPADGFKVDRVMNLGTFYRLFFRAKQGEKAITNMWQVGDLAICLTFNAAEGTNFNVSNKYYWAVVVNVDSNIKVAGDENIYHYIDISKETYEGTLNPEVGDEIAMLGSRSSNVRRQSAIYIAAYNSVDPSLTAPLFCQYHGINDFNLQSHKYTWLAANGSVIRGNIKLESGQDIEDYIDYKAITITSTLIEYATNTNGSTPPASGWQTSIPSTPANHYLWTRTTVNYSDGTTTVSYSVGKIGAKGDAGADGNSYTGNLLFGTKDFSGSNWVNLQYWTPTGEYYRGCKVYSRSVNNYGVYLLAEVEAGKTYTFSAYIKSDGGDIRYYFSGAGSAVVTPLNKDVPETDGWQRVSASFKCTTSGTVGCRILKATGNGAVYIAGLKLEEGENPNSAWTPHNTENLSTEFYKLMPSQKNAVVNKNDTLALSFDYKIQHIKGETVEYVEADRNKIFIRAFASNGYGGWLDFSCGSLFALYHNNSFFSNYSKTTNRPLTFSVQLTLIDDEGSYTVVDEDNILVTFEAAATLQITDEIKATVQGHTESLNDLDGRITTNTNSITEVTQTANSISSTVTSHTTQLNTLSGTVEGHTTQISSLQQTAAGLTSTVESHTTDINGNKTSISQLQQTAEQILLQVNNVALQVTDKKIVLDGDTEVNGTVNINKDGTGFKLNGSGGETFTIASNDIGTYSNFESKTLYNWWHTFNLATVNFDTAQKEVKISSLCTTLKAGQRLRITNLYAKTTDYSFANSSITSLTVNVYRGSVQPVNKVALLTLTNIAASSGYWYQGSSAFSGNKSAIIDYTATASGDYYVEIDVNFNGTVSGYTKLDSMLACEISLNAFGNLAYNGFGFNFGSGKVAFIGEDLMIFKMGQKAGLRITSDNGLQRLVPESHRYNSANIMHYYANSGQWIGVNDCIVRIVSDLSAGSNQGSVDMVSPLDEVLVVKNISYSIILILPAASSCAGKTYIIKNRSASDNLFVGVGSLTTTNSAGNIITYNGNTGYNDSCNLTTAAGTTTYRLLMKCSKNVHRLISDGEKWLDCLLT